jgi:hypothetical protein
MSKVENLMFPNMAIHTFDTNVMEVYSTFFLAFVLRNNNFEKISTSQLYVGKWSYVFNNIRY